MLKTGQAMKAYYKDYSRENLPFRQGILENIKDVLALKTEYEHEKYIGEFESCFAAYNNSGYAVALNSGTTALELALRICKIKKGDEVIVPSYTYIATALAVSHVGAKPVFADIEETTLTIKPGDIKKKITGRTKALIAVHLHGNPADMAEVAKIAGSYSLKIIEDCSHAHGAEYNGTKVGNFGIGCFSCHTDKNLGAVGNAGIITTDDKKIYEKLIEVTRVMNEPSIELFNRTPCRMDALQAAILKAKLPHLDVIINKKTLLGKIYCRNLPPEITPQKKREKGKHAYRDFAVRAPKAMELCEYLKKNAIQAKKGYVPLHLTRYYRYFLKNKLPKLSATERIYKNMLWLPLSSTMDSRDVEHICQAIRSFYS